MFPAGRGHVVPANGGWAVTIDNAPECVSQHRIQVSAIMIGRHLAQSTQAELLIHGRDGQVRKCWHYPGAYGK